MSVLSLLRQVKPASLASFTKIGFGNGLLKNNFQLANNEQCRLLSTSLVRGGGGGHDRTMVILPSRYQWHKYKDGFHFYLFLGLIPVLGIVFYTNCFIGPATLSEIPCGYEPKIWEHFRHPITRFIAQYICVDPQQTYERNMHYIKEMDDARRLRKLSKKIRELMQQRGDYPNYYSSPIMHGKYIRSRVQENIYVESIRGEE